MYASNNTQVSSDIYKTDSLMSGLKVFLSGNYDIITSESNPILTANYVCNNETYLVSERFKLWGAIDKEVIHVYRFAPFDSFDEVLQQSWSSGIKELNPSKGHRSSNIITILLCESVSEEFARAVGRYVRRKSFLFTFNGTVTHRAVAVDLTNGRVHHGKGTKELAERIGELTGNDEQ